MRNGMAINSGIKDLVNWSRMKKESIAGDDKKKKKAKIARLPGDRSIKASVN